MKDTADQRSRHISGASGETSAEALEDGQLGFVNPYNFISTPDRSASYPLGLSTHAPKPHSSYAEDCYSGRFRVTMTTMTPLLLTRARLEARGRVISVRTGPTGEPLIRGSEIKGMLRGAYESITNSRFGVFGNHDRRLSLRQGFPRAWPLYVGVVRPGPNNSKVVDATVPVYVPYGLLSGEMSDGAVVYAKIVQIAAKLENHDTGTAKSKRKESPSVNVWYARQLFAAEDVARSCPLAEDELLVVGQLFVTGHTIDGKKHERLVVTQVVTPGTSSMTDFRACTVEIPPVHECRWNDLIASYVEIHRDGRFPAPPNQETDERATTLGPYTAPDSDWRELKPGRAVFVRIDRAGPSSRLAMLTPAAISRITFDGVPPHLLPDGMRPARTHEELSPADRVFGWTRTDTDGSHRYTPGHRGQLRIGRVNWDQGQADLVSTFPEAFLLATLSSPKPAQARFYTGDRDQKPLASDASMDSQHAFDPATRKLRGRKVYMSQPDLQDSLSEYFAPNRNSDSPTPVHVGDALRYREYVHIDNPNFEQQAGGGNQKMNTWVESWVRPSARCHFDIHFDNLDRCELGALVWMMRLPDGATLSLGMGKPFGFGRVTLRLKESESEIHDAGSLRRRYLFDESDSKSSVGERRGELLRAVKEEFSRYQAADAGLTRVRDEFLAATRGIRGVPVHYPRADQNHPGNCYPPPDAKPYRWWVENNDAKTYVPQSLPGLTDDRSADLKYSHRKNGK